jgi:hypothetical protein
MTSFYRFASEHPWITLLLASNIAWVIVRLLPWSANDEQ